LHLSGPPLLVLCRDDAILLHLHAVLAAHGCHKFERRRLGLGCEALDDVCTVQVSWRSGAVRSVVGEWARGSDVLYSWVMTPPLLRIDSLQSSTTLLGVSLGKLMMTERWAAMANDVRNATQTEATAKRMSTSRRWRAKVGGVCGVRRVRGESGVVVCCLYRAVQW
jgi:hypothetical protein